MTKSTFHDQDYEYISWQELGNDIFELAQQLLESGREFDRVVALAKGGLTFSRSLVDYLAIPHLSSLQIEFYTDVNQTAKTPVITQSLPVTVQGEKILVFDDVVDSGETLKMATQYLKFHGASELTTAALVTKDWTEFLPDFKARQSGAWFIFPNETRETIALLTEKWAKKGDSPEVITQQLQQVGFSAAEVALFSSLK